MRIYNSLFSRDKSFVKRIRSLIGFTPANLGIFKLAFYHKSTTSDKLYAVQSNERLEYLGDAVLATIVAEYLFKKYPNSNEGFLTKMRSKIVKRQSLNIIADKMGLDVFLNQYNNTRLSRSMLGNALEALVGAIYLEKGYNGTKRFVINKILLGYLDIHELESFDDNYKSQLLEWCQKNGKTVSYKMVSKYKFEKRDRFKVAVLIDGEKVAIADDFNKKSAEQTASEKAMKILGILMVPEDIEKKSNKNKKGYRKPRADRPSKGKDNRSQDRPSNKKNNQNRQDRKPKDRKEKKTSDWDDLNIEKETGIKSSGHPKAKNNKPRNKSNDRNRQPKKEEGANNQNKKAQESSAKSSEASQKNSNPRHKRSPRNEDAPKRENKRNETRPDTPEKPKSAEPTQKANAPREKSNSTREQQEPRKENPRKDNPRNERHRNQQPKEQSVKQDRPQPQAKTNTQKNNTPPVEEVYEDIDVPQLSGVDASPKSPKPKYRRRPNYRKNKNQKDNAKAEESNESTPS